MKIYLKGYGYRWKELLVAVLCIVSALLLNIALFQNKLNKLNAQLSSYAEADYSYIYILNYDALLENTFLFPDTDAQVFIDDSKSTRLAVSGIMASESGSYTSRSFLFAKALKANEMAISKNVADNYGIGVKESLFVELPYSTELQKYTVMEIVQPNYDFMNPNADNDVGIIFLGYDADFETNVLCKYITFSANSEAEKLSEYPQIINSVINKAENEEYIFRQGIPILVFQGVFTVIAMVLGYLLFFSRSERLLVRCYLKGMKKSCLVGTLFFERIVFIALPAVITLLGISRLIPVSSMLTKIYFAIPVFVICVFCVAAICKELIRTRRKGAESYGTA